MSIKIIKEGKAPPPPTYKGKCDNCGCVCTFNEGDGHITRYYREDCLYISCPTPKCGQLLYGSKET